ncbi:hypothetical protein JCM16418_3994 [Paenibacillus pini JCM 16418]|uniref:Uncharacterized protein n=1 Tax=Paenibacillus pini JCM 16418 TaxID=1236976 RepID=W7YQY4_9BACL|nr:hypothetical protein JCM16418_3994 [Paenibacillus pini JCM 16418]
MFHIKKWILPAPAIIAKEAQGQSDILWDHTLATIQLTLIGFLIGTLIGLVIAIMLHLIPFLKSACTRYSSLARTFQPSLLRRYS